VWGKLGGLGYVLPGKDKLCGDSLDDSAVCAEHAISHFKGLVKHVRERIRFYNNDNSGSARPSGGSAYATRCVGTEHSRPKVKEHLCKQMSSIETGGDDRASRALAVILFSAATECDRLLAGFVLFVYL
jgi:hypothetical protein